jgi:hypothetical protein
LVNSYGYRKESWADSLKNAVSSVFGWDKMMLEGRTKESRLWREQVDTWWSERLGREITPRNVLQLWGTEVCRAGYHDDIWIASLENKIRKSNDDIVISDCRFPNELESVKRLGGITIRVKRGPDPDWVSALLFDFAHFKAKYPTVHASEYSSVNLQYDYTIENNSTIMELQNKINDLVRYHQPST